VGQLDPEEMHERATVGCMLRQTDRTGDTAAPRTSGTVVEHEAIPAGEDRLVEQRREPVGEDPRVDEYHGLSPSMQLELKLNAVEYRPIQLHPPRVRREQQAIRPAAVLLLSHSS
jgi:hypothetical protein